MKLSVIVPVYNDAMWLDECLASVLDEADTDVELVCVDDGSTDGSGEMLDDAAARCRGRSCIMRVIHQRNAGAGAARNAGLDAVRGDWILFLDGDDVLARGWLPLVRTMAGRHPSAQMLGFGREESLPLKPVALGESREVDVARIVGFDVFERGMWQYAYRRELIAGLRFEHIILVEDKLFQGAALLRASRVAVTDDRAYGYRQREGSVAHSEWNAANFGAEVAWRVKWLEAMTAAGKTMDRRLWRYMGLSLLEYAPHKMFSTRSDALRRELEGLWYDSLGRAARFGFSPWQRFAMFFLGAARCRSADILLSRLPFALKQKLRRRRTSR